MKNFNILILEDEALIALRIKQLLEKNSLCVIGIAQDSTQALHLIQEHKVDLILADITIKGDLNGIQTVKLIQESFNIPAIFLTSHQEEKFLKEASKVNFTGYIVKPFIEETLMREVKLAYHRYAQSTEHKLLRLTDAYVYDFDAKSLKKDGKDIVLSKNEKFFLNILISNRNSPVSNETIDQLLWADIPVDDVNRRHLVFRLRKKLPELKIETVTGVGYKLVV